MSNQSDDLVLEKALGNGQFLDIDYYITDIDTFMTIGKYNAFMKPVIATRPIYTLLQYQFPSLQGSRWILTKNCRE